ncbi:MAG: glycosyltransferase [Trueperaceae bacterium]|nr:glycosyltransferase [Trueperaceae bacterium]
MTTFLIVLPYALALPYVGLMVLVILGLFRRDPAARTESTASVSVVIPAHDEEASLPGTLASLSAQTYPGDAEFVIVDDRSRDATARIVRDAQVHDPRIRLVQVHEPDRRLAPKVNAVAHGIAASTGEIIVTSDADCRYPDGWLEGMVGHFADDVVMVVGYVETTRAHRVGSFLHRFETIDWSSLMTVSRSLTRFGWKFASSANNQAYRRSAFEAAGGFGAIGRAPSGDEDLLTQRLGRLPGSRIVFAATPATRVLTHPIASWGALFRQRRRWVSRYHHPMHYHPGFLASIGLLGFQSIALAGAVLATPFVPSLAPWTLGLWGAEIALMTFGVGLGALQVGRRDLVGPGLVAWAALHPFFIAAVVIASLLKSGEWRAGADPYRRRWLQRRWRAWRRRLRPTPSAVRNDRR